MWGQAATVYIGNYDAPVSGTVDSVSNSTSITSNGLSARQRSRVKLANPGACLGFLHGLCPDRQLRQLRPDAPSIWVEPPLSTPVPAAPFRA